MEGNGYVREMNPVFNPKWWLCLLLAVLLICPASAPAEGKVFYSGETEPFPEDTELLTIRVAGIMGGDCMLMTLGDHSMFVDLGPKSCLPYIKELIELAGIDHVDSFFNTHPHLDHIGGFKPLVDSGFPVGEMMTLFPHDLIANFVLQVRAVNAANEHHIPIVDIKDQDQIPFGGAELTVYKIPDKYITREYPINDQSAMLMVRYGECSVLLSGDLEIRGQLKMVELYGDRLKADILKTPHHGNPLKPVFYKTVDPEFCFITHTANDTRKTQELLQTYGRNRMAFASWGVITLQTDGQKWIVSQTVYPEKEGHAKKYLRYHPKVQTPVIFDDSISGQ